MDTHRQPYTYVVHDNSCIFLEIVQLLIGVLYYFQLFQGAKIQKRTYKSYFFLRKLHFSVFLCDKNQFFGDFC